MDEQPTFTFEHPEYGTLEVPLPEGYLNADDVATSYVPKTVFNQEMAKLRTKAKSLVDPASILEDEEFRTKALETWGVDPTAPDKSVDTEALTAKVTERLRRSEVEPLVQERDALQEEVGTLRRAKLISALVQAASGIVRPSLLKPPAPGQDPPIINLLGGYFDYNPEIRDWGIREGETFAYSSKPTNANPYKGPAEFLLEWAADKANADFVVDDRQRGPNLNTPPGPKGAITLSREEAKDAQKYRAAADKAAEAGVELVIT